LGILAIGLTVLVGLVVVVITCWCVRGIIPPLVVMGAGVVVRVVVIVIVSIALIVVSDYSAGNGQDRYGDFLRDAVYVVANDQAGGGAENGPNDGVIRISESRPAETEADEKR
jgi:hypothetical protein